MNKGEIDPLTPQLPTRSTARKGCVDVKKAFTSCSVYLATSSTAITIVSSILFAIFFSRAVSGFARQINSFVPLGNFGSTFLSVVISLLVAVFAIYLLIVHLASVKVFRNCLSCFGSNCSLLFSSLVSQGFLVAWVLVLCLVSSLTLVYFIFIGSIYSFCSLVDSQCFNFNVLLPAIMSRVSNKQVDLTFCQEKKELLCNRSNNMIWNFGWAFIFAICTFCGCLFAQNCVVYGFGKRTERHRRKAEEAYEMRQR